MKVGMKKIWWSIPMLLVLATIIYYGYLQQEKTSPVILSFRIGTEDTAETISAWYDDEGTYYVFLPSYADIQTVTASVNPAYMVEVDGTALTSETDLSAFTLGEPYNIRITHGWETAEEQICFLQSANVATMYIDTQSGSMQHIHADKEYRESVQVRLIDANGGINYCGANDKLKGRGNTTWSAQKKPYTLKLSESNGLLGMDEFKEWALLANALDKTNLRNKMIYDFARDVNPNLDWSPDCEYIDLYLNSVYAGLYLLCEKAESVGAAKSISDNDYLFCIDQQGKLDNPNTAIKLNSHVYAEIVLPNNANELRVSLLRKYLFRFQEALYTSDANEHQVDNWLAYIDIDSFSRKYLIEEIFANVDASQDSQYFCVNASTGKMFAGPCWDYDLTLGEKRVCKWWSPRCFWAQKGRNSWYWALWQKEEFRAYVQDIFQKEFLPQIENLLTMKACQIAEHAEKAYALDNVRWPRQLDSEESIETILDFLRERVAFLNSAWVEGDEYCTISFNLPEGIYSSSLCIPTNSVCEEVPEPTVMGFPNTARWYREDTNEPFDYNSVITEDLTLYVKGKETTADSSPLAYISLHKAMLFRLAIVGLSGVVLLALILVDYKRNRVKR